MIVDEAPVPQLRVGDTPRLGCGAGLGSRGAVRSTWAPGTSQRVRDLRLEQHGAAALSTDRSSVGLFWRDSSRRRSGAPSFSTSQHELPGSGDATMDADADHRVDAFVCPTPAKVDWQSSASVLRQKFADELLKASQPSRTPTPSEGSRPSSFTPKFPPANFLVGRSNRVGELVTRHTSAA